MKKSGLVWILIADQALYNASVVLTVIGSSRTGN